MFILNLLSGQSLGLPTVLPSIAHIKLNVNGTVETQTKYASFDTDGVTVVDTDDHINVLKTNSTEAVATPNEALFSVGGILLEVAA